MSIQNQLPELPYLAWTNTRLTMHLILQIIGKTRLKLTARKNHWWYITIYVSPRGFTTHSIPSNNGLDSIEIEFNIIKKAVTINTSNGREFQISLSEQVTVAAFYKEFMQLLKDIGHEPDFVKKPFDLGIDKPFSELTEYHHYDWEYIHRFWKIMRWNNDVFQEFSGRFYGKTCPVHIYWHHLDLTVTRFSGRKLPAMESNTKTLEKDTYSHEQISFGFWAGDDQVQEPTYYSYTFPSPTGIDEEILQPDGAKWVESNGSPLALLRYELVRNAVDPRAAVLDFLESAYQAGAKRADWDIEGFEVPALDQL